MKKIGFLILLALILNINAKANGGPVDGSAVYKTGNIVLIKHANIKLEKEILKIKLEGDYSIISVTYQLKNNNNYDIDVTYGFPIDIKSGGTNYDMEWKEEYVPYIQFTANEINLPVKRQLDYSIFKSKSNKIDEENFEYRRNWYVVDFSIDKGETVNLIVNYKVKNGYIDWSTSKSFFESYSERELIYDLSPAQYWGDGIIDKLKIEIDASDVIKNGEELDLHGLELKNISGKYINKFSNFDLKTAQDLYISYNNKVEKISKYILEHRIPSSYIKSIEVSSQLEGNYSKANMFDNNFKTAWVEGVSGNGIGEKIKIELNNYTLDAVCLINGYSKNSDTYTENNRIKKIKIEIEKVDYQDSNNIIAETFDKEFEDLPFININLNNFYSLTGTIDDYRLGYTKVLSITITILEVYKGTKYDDTCISELYLLGYQWKN